MLHMAFARIKSSPHTRSRKFQKVYLYMKPISAKSHSRLCVTVHLAAAKRRACGSSCREQECSEECFCICELFGR